jgi:[ribosomal protein S18]-alanine N-acetyltransferase
VIELRPMTRAHVPAVAGLERDLFAAEPWSERTLRAELTEPGRYYLVALEGEQVVGYGGLADFGVEGHVMTLGVRADRQRQGLGDRLLRALLAEAGRRRIRRVLLEVAADNDAAKRLYGRHGFRPVGLRRNYYQATGTDAVVMSRDTAAGTEGGADVGG